jgi:hypothetical protein
MNKHHLNKPHLAELYASACIHLGLIKPVGAPKTTRQGLIPNPDKELAAANKRLKRQQKRLAWANQYQNIKGATNV